MAKPILQQLFDGEVFPSENINPDNPVYNETRKALDEETDCLLNALSGDDADRFHRITDLYCKMASIYNYECFAHGFRLATALMVESMDSKNNPCWK